MLFNRFQEKSGNHIIVVGENRVKSSRMLEAKSCLPYNSFNLNWIVILLLISCCCACSNEPLIPIERSLVPFYCFCSKQQMLFSLLLTEIREPIHPLGSVDRETGLQSNHTFKKQPWLV